MGTLSKSKPFSGFSVDDVQTAKAFYGETLGLDVKEAMGGSLELAIGDGHSVFVYPKPNHAPATYTVLNFAVDDVDRAVDDLTRVGVKFEAYDMPDLKTDDKGIARDERGPTIAWSKAPAGNILSVLENA